MAKPYGYAGKILRVDLSTGNIASVPTTAYADRFLGGRGFAAKIYWDEVPPDVTPFDPENRLMFMIGPLAGFPTLSGNRWTVCGKSPFTIPEQFSYCNLGGNWGVWLKFAGYDGIVVQGRSDKPVYLFVQDDKVEIRDASTLWGKTSIEARELLKTELGKSVSVVACGQAGENMVRLASLLADDDASGSSGFGAVMGSKKLKAIAVSGSGRAVAANPERLRELTRHVRHLLRGHGGVDVWGVMSGPKIEKQVCYGCLGPCIRRTYEAQDGTKGKFTCGSAAFYQDRAKRYYGEWNDVPFRATKLLDGYGLDAQGMHVVVMWLTRCHKAGILTDENTGIPISKVGSLEFVETFIKKVSLRDGFGDILAQGAIRAADIVGKGSKELITDYSTKEGVSQLYCPRMYIVSELLYAMEPRLAIQQLHEIGDLIYPWLDWLRGVEGSCVSTEVFRKIARRFWGGELAADFSTHEGKALAVKMIQDREYVKESLILCDWMWPIRYSRHTDDHVGDPSLESNILSAVTGTEVTETELYKVGERIFNLQMAVLAREGHRGRESDVIPEVFYTRPLRSSWINPECLALGKDGEIISRKGAVVDREKFERLKDEYYQLRGWDVATGLQTKAKLEEIGLGETVKDLEQRHLVV